MEKRKVVPIRNEPRDIVSQDEMKSLRMSQEMVSQLARAVGSKAAAMAERINRGAWVESGEEEFDTALLCVRPNRAS